MFIRSILVAGLMALGAAGALAASDARPEPQAHDEGFHRGGHHGAGLSVEHAAMHNLMASLIANTTGRSEAEIRALFASGDPRDAAQKLGLSRDDMHGLMKQARGQLIDKAAAAGLITADQAAELRAAQMPEPPEHDGPPPAQ